MARQAKFRDDGSITDEPARDSEHPQLEQQLDMEQCAADAKRLAELKKENPGAVIIPPGQVKAIDGKTYHNDTFIIAKGGQDNGKTSDSQTGTN